VISAGLENENLTYPDVWCVQESAESRRIAVESEQRAEVCPSVWMHGFCMQNQVIGCVHHLRRLMSVMDQRGRGPGISPGSMSCGVCPGGGDPDRSAHPAGQRGGGGEADRAGGPRELNHHMCDDIQCDIVTPRGLTPESLTSNVRSVQASAAEELQQLKSQLAELSASNAPLQSSSRTVKTLRTEKKRLLVRVKELEEAERHLKFKSDGILAEYDNICAEVKEEKQGLLVRAEEAEAANRQLIQQKGALLMKVKDVNKENATATAALAIVYHWDTAVMEAKGRRDLNLIAAQEQALAQHRNATQVCFRQSMFDPDEGRCKVLIPISSVVCVYRRRRPRCSDCSLASRRWGRRRRAPSNRPRSRPGLTFSSGWRR
jgi:hypothetical protein